MKFNTVLFVNATIVFSENLFLVLMIACTRMALHSRRKAEGHDGCPEVNTGAIPLHETNNLVISLLLGLTWTHGFNQAIMGFGRDLWISLGH